MMKDDLIRRQDVKEWFCTNYCSEHNKCEVEEICFSMEELRNLPSAESPIVRCEECKYWSGDGYYCDYDMCGHANDFCSWGKRRADDETD